jgi:hypothetical protein
MSNIVFVKKPMLQNIHTDARPSTEGILLGLSNGKKLGYWGFLVVVAPAAAFGFATGVAVGGGSVITTDLMTSSFG